MTQRILLVDDDADLAREMGRVLATRGHEVDCRFDADSAFEALSGSRFDAVVTDLNMGRSNGLDLCHRVITNWRDLPVVVMTAFATLETAVATLRAGAFDFLAKPFTPDQLGMVVERALALRSRREDLEKLREHAREGRSFGDMIGASPPMERLFDLIARVAGSEVSVLVTGESGTGKELAARALHGRSRRSGGPVVAVNCAALPESLLESELFGHAKGAFTDARSPRKGLFVEADGGTLFLDEIGEMPLPTQAKLRRALESRRVRPLGSNTEVPFDARLVVATNRDLESMVREKTFREDLFYRIHVVQVELPPLRARGQDVVLLAQTFVERMARRHGKDVEGFTPEVAERLLAYDWPGNVRELQNTIDRAVALAGHRSIVVDDLPPKLRQYTRQASLHGVPDQDVLCSLEELERRHIDRVMNAVGWSKVEATRILGIDRSTLYRKLERYGLRAPSTPS